MPAGLAWGPGRRPTPESVHMRYTGSRAPTRGRDVTSQLEVVRVSPALIRKAAGHRGMPDAVRSPAEIARWCIAYVAGVSDPTAEALPKGGYRGKPIQDQTAA